MRWWQGEVCWERWAVGLEPWGWGARVGQHQAAGPAGCGQQERGKGAVRWNQKKYFTDLKIK